MKKRCKKGAFLPLALVLIACMALSAALIGCSNGDDGEEVEVKSNEKNITGFKIGNSNGFILQDEILILLPSGTYLGNLAPEIKVSELAEVFPASGEANDFSGSEPAVYTVRAENGSIKRYTVNITTVTDTSPLELTVGLVPGGNNNLAIYGIPETGIVLSVSGNNGPKSIIISAGASTSSGDSAVYDNGETIYWYINDHTTTHNTSDNIIKIDAADYAYTKPHTITLIATKDGIQHSMYVTFTVVE